MYAVLSRSLPASVRRDGSRVDKRPSGHKLTQLEEDQPAQWVISMDTCGAAPGKMANILLAARSSQPPPSVGKNWPSKFVERRHELRTCFLVRYNYQNALNEDPKALQAWFATVQNVIEKNGVQAEDIYNFDETDFAMGLISSQKVVLQAEYYGRSYFPQLGNCKWVTTIEAICADGYSVPPYIFKISSLI